MLENRYRKIKYYRLFLSVKVYENMMADKDEDKGDGPSTMELEKTIMKLKEDLRFEK